MSYMNPQHIFVTVHDAVLYIQQQKVSEQAQVLTLQSVCLTWVSEEVPLCATGETSRIHHNRLGLRQRDIGDLWLHPRECLFQLPVPIFDPNCTVHHTFKDSSPLWHEGWTAVNIFFKWQFCHFSHIYQPYNWYSDTNYQGRLFSSLLLLRNHCLWLKKTVINILYSYLLICYHSDIYSVCNKKWNALSSFQNICMLWNTVFECAVSPSYFWNIEDNSGNKEKGVSSNQAHHFSGLRIHFFPEKVWNVKHAKSFWSEKNSVLCINMTSEMGLNNCNN